MISEKQTQNENICFFQYLLFVSVFACLCVIFMIAVGF